MEGPECPKVKFEDVIGFLPAGNYQKIRSKVRLFIHRESDLFTCDEAIFFMQLWAVATKVQCFAIMLYPPPRFFTIIMGKVIRTLETIEVGGTKSELSEVNKCTCDRWLIYIDFHRHCIERGNSRNERVALLVAKATEVDRTSASGDGRTVGRRVSLFRHRLFHSPREYLLLLPPQVIQRRRKLSKWPQKARNGHPSATRATS